MICWLNRAMPTMTPSGHPTLSPRQSTMGNTRAPTCLSTGISASPDALPIHQQKSRLDWKVVSIHNPKAPSLLATRLDISINAIMLLVLVHWLVSQTSIITPSHWATPVAISINRPTLLPLVIQPVKPIRDWMPWPLATTQGTHLRGPILCPLVIRQVSRFNRRMLWPLAIWQVVFHKTTIQSLLVIMQAIINRALMLFRSVMMRVCTNRVPIL